MSDAKTAHRYGFWPSRWSAANAAAASRDFAELRAGHGGVLWVEFDPADARSTLWFHRAGERRCLSPAGVSLRSRVYEYGGGAFCVTLDGVAFVGEADQQVYRQALDGNPCALTDCALCRYGDLQHDAFGDALLAVEEEHGDAGVRHRIVSLSLRDGAREVAIEGADFYAAPTLRADGRRLAWIEWSRPEQPWTATRLCVAERDADGRWGGPRCLAGAEGGTSLQQPRFAQDGRLHCLSDADGWWQPWVEQGGQWQPLDDMAIAPSDHAAAPWQLGACSYLPLENGLLLSRFEDGFGVLAEATSAGERRLAEAFTRFRQLAADDRHFYAIAASPERVSAILAIERDSGTVAVLAGGDFTMGEGDLARPEALCFPSGEGEAHAFFYPPRNADCHAIVEEKPPLVVFLHGGPTSACYPVFDPRIQFWTQRGFAVADLNYRGSSGFGCDYRNSLRTQWGVSDVQDACSLLQHLARRSLVDPRRAFIRGGSAGGYTALCALAFADAFCGGASLYGVSDPLALGRVTHKFEADYLDWLIGDPQRDAGRYAARTPLLHAQRISVPVIFFQGGRDAVVLPSQTESMVEALRRNGIAVEYHLYPEERHGFRQAAHLAEVLECEWRFYQALL